MDDKVLVTIRNGNEDEDFAIPANVRIDKWIGQIQDYYYKKNSQTFLSGKKLSLYFDGNEILGKDNAHLLNIEDGSCLLAVWR